jgi:hypothetical protein
VEFLLHRYRLTGQSCSVGLEPGGGDQLEVGRYDVPGLEQREVARDDLGRGEHQRATGADHARLWRGELA